MKHILNGLGAVGGMIVILILIAICALPMAIGYAVSMTAGLSEEISNLIGFLFFIFVITIIASIKDKD
jgi:hypothetical protein